MALSFIGNGGALYYKDKNMNKLTDNEYSYADEIDLSRIRSHVRNEVEKEKKEYEQLEFEFDEDLVAPI
jgi:hypothetical protein